MKKLNLIYLLLNKLKFLKVFTSPFVRPKVKIYFGKTTIGTPYFLPRKWVKATPDRAKKAALEEIENIKRYNELNAKNGTSRTIPPFEQIYNEKLRYEFAVPKKIGFDLVGLGFKTKWTDTDYRFEWGPLLSFVFFGYQIAFMLKVPDTSHYWESWLFYDRNTDKTKSMRERIEQCKKEFPQNWKTTSNGETKQINYYDTILKADYRDVPVDEKRDAKIESILN